MTLRALSYGLYALTLVGAAVGLAVVPLRDRRWLQVALAFVVFNLGLFLFLHVKSRYRIQFLPVLFVYAGCAVAWLAARLGWAPLEEGWRRNVPVWAWGLAGLLLFLAFGGRWLG